MLSFSTARQCPLTGSCILMDRQFGSTTKSEPSVRGRDKKRVHHRIRCQHVPRFLDCVTDLPNRPVFCGLFFGDFPGADNLARKSSATSGTGMVGNHAFNQFARAPVCCSFAVFESNFIRIISLFVSIRRRPRYRLDCRRADFYSFVDLQPDSLCCRDCPG